MTEKARQDEKGKLLQSAFFDPSNHNNLDLRVLNRKMIYCIGIPCTMTDEEIESHDYFGQYGNIRKIVVMNGNKYQNTTSVYITYADEQ